MAGAGEPVNRAILIFALGLGLILSGALFAEMPSRDFPPADLNSGLRELSLQVKQLQKDQEALSWKVEKVLENQQRILEELERIRLRV